VSAGSVSGLLLYFAAVLDGRADLSAPTNSSDQVKQCRPQRIQVEPRPARPPSRWSAASIITAH
jgi:hypothetical protein